mmetsp:Transcript_35319/g.82536  ORF Transcript_35319/g.82536 Transcript_35319/m.82536 type:complete len:108 (-) Transcript_35319:199-522(-)
MEIQAERQRQEQRTSHGNGAQGHATPRRDENEAPNEYACPITMDIMVDPVLAMDGHSYERAAIENWLRQSQKSPKTNALLPSKMLLPNHALRGMIIEWRERRQAAGS